MQRSRHEIQDWRRFELMVSRLERALQPTGCAIRSPDFLLDHETGEKREVDCSITLPGDGEARISIECRKRGARQDVTWIEQLATKRVALRLAETIAVSSRGFSTSAYRKARHHGLTLNTYQEITVAIASRPLAINHTRVTWTLKQFAYEIDEQHPESPYDEVQRIEREIVAGGRDSALLRVIHSSAEISLGEFIDYVASQIDATVPNKSERRFKIGFREPTTLACMSDPIPLLAVNLELEEHRVTQRVDEPVLGTYSSLDRVLLHVARAKCAQHQLTVFFRVLDCQ